MRSGTYPRYVNNELGLPPPPLEAIAGIVIDCADGRALSEFYEQATGGVVVRSAADGDFINVGGVLLLIRELPDYAAPTWPASEVPTQFHLDFYVADLVEAEARLQSLGATTPEHQVHRDEVLVVMLDPAGHPFCIATRDGVPPELQV